MVKITGSTLRGQKWRFFEVRSSAVCCPFELKIAWGLCLALKSSQKNFQLKRTAHGWGLDLEKSPKSPFSEILKNRPKSEKWPKKAFLGTYGFSSVLFSIFQLILAKFYDFFFELANWFGGFPGETPASFTNLWVFLKGLGGSKQIAENARSRLKWAE